MASLRQTGLDSFLQYESIKPRLHARVCSRLREVEHARQNISFSWEALVPWPELWAGHNCSFWSLLCSPSAKGQAPECWQWLPSQWWGMNQVLKGHCAKSCLTLWSHGLQHAKLPHPSLSPRVCSVSCPLSQWCHPTISSSVAPYFPCPQSCPAPGSLPKSRLFASGGQIIGASASVIPMNIQCWFPLGLTNLISLLSKGLSGVFSSTTIQRHQFSGAQLSLSSNSHIRTKKNHIAERVIGRSQSLSCHHSSKSEGSCLSLMVSKEKSLGFLVAGGTYRWVGCAP